MGDKIEERAQKILENHHDGKFPINPVKIAQLIGYEVLAFDGEKSEFGNVSGIVDHENKKIFFNSNEPSTRNRFTIAHEIGHIILHPDQDHVDFRSPFPGGIHEIKEQEANKFAAALLMPKNEFKKIFEKSADFYKISSYFGVSKIATNIRAFRLGLINGA